MTTASTKICMKRELAPVCETQIPGIRRINRVDIECLGRLFYAAYVGTVDYEGETEDESVAAVRSAFEGQFGPLLEEASMLFEKAGEPVSAAIITSWNGQPLLAFAVTRPDCQRQGLSRLCISAAMRALAAAGHRELHLFVTKTNAPAIALYNRLGFRPVDGPS